MPPANERGHVQKERWGPRPVQNKIKEPKNFTFNGTAQEQLLEIVDEVRMTVSQVKLVQGLFDDIAKVLQMRWPGCSVHPFGSIVMGLATKMSDADCFVYSPSPPTVLMAKRLLMKFPQKFTQVLAIPRASTPIVKFVHAPTGFHCDLTFKSYLGVRNSQLIALLLNLDKNFLLAAVFLKYWGRLYEISGSSKLTNYAIVMMLIFYLQQQKLLPSIAYLQRNSESFYGVDGWNTGFEASVDIIPDPAVLCPATQLIGEFFDYYSTFDFEKQIICPYLGRPVEKELFSKLETVPEEFTLYKSNVANEFLPLLWSRSICIQDPFELNRNVSSSIGTQKLKDIRAYIKFVADTYNEDRSNDHANFFKTVLLEKPEFSNRTKHCSIMIRWQHYNQIPKRLFKMCARDIILIIFEDIYQLELLGKNDVFDFEVHRLVWNRKRFAKPYAYMKLDYLEKEKRITNDLLKADQTKFDLSCRLSIKVAKPFMMRFTMKYRQGDVKKYNEFSTALMNDFNGLFMRLVQYFVEEGYFQEGEHEVDDTAPAAELGQDESHNGATIGSDDSHDENEDDLNEIGDESNETEDEVNGKTGAGSNKVNSKGDKEASNVDKIESKDIMVASKADNVESIGVVVSSVDRGASNDHKVELNDNSVKNVKETLAVQQKTTVDAKSSSDTKENKKNTDNKKRRRNKKNIHQVKTALTAESSLK